MRRWRMRVINVSAAFQPLTRDFFQPSIHQLFAACRGLWLCGCVSVRRVYFRGTSRRYFLVNQL